MLTSIRDIADLQNLKLPKEFRDNLVKLDKTIIQIGKDRIESQQDYYNEL